MAGEYGTWTTVPDVRAKLVDVVLPAVVATLPATITVSGQTIPVLAPVISFGHPGQNVPSSLIAVHDPSAQIALSQATLPALGARSVKELYAMPIRIWYMTGDQSSGGQRVATTIAWTMFRALQTWLRDPANKLNLANLLAPPGVATMRNVTSTEWFLAEGRACELTCELEIDTRT